MLLANCIWGSAFKSGSIHRSGSPESMAMPMAWPTATTMGMAWPLAMLGPAPGPSPWPWPWAMPMDHGLRPCRAWARPGPGPGPGPRPLPNLPAPKQKQVLEKWTCPISKNGHIYRIFGAMKPISSSMTLGMASGEPALSTGHCVERTLEN